MKQEMMNQLTYIASIHQQHSLIQDEKRTFDDTMEIHYMLKLKADFKNVIYKTTDNWY